MAFPSEKALEWSKRKLIFRCCHLVGSRSLSASHGLTITCLQFITGVKHLLWIYYALFTSHYGSELITAWLLSQLVAARSICYHGNLMALIYDV